MGLLAPLFLAGLVAVALPLWLHRLETQSSNREPFSSAMLLETADRQVHVRKKLKYLLLLSARIALLVMVVLAFAQPFLSRPPAMISATDAGTRVVLVDTSASMGAAGVFEQAIAEAERAIDEAPADALLQIIGAGRSLGIVGSLTNDKAAARASVRTLAPGELRGDYGEIMSAVERVAAGLPPPVSLHFVSDFQASAMPARFPDVIPAGVAGLTPRVVGTGEPFNWSVDYLRVSADGIDVGVSGIGDRERVGDVELVVDGVVIHAQGLSHSGHQNLRFDAPEWAAGESRVEFRINADDDLGADNAWYHVVDNAPPEPVPLITGDPAGLPVTYLSAALDSTGRYRVETRVAGEFDPRILSRHRWAVIDDAGYVDRQLETALTEFTGNGGNLLVFAGERAAARESLPVSGHRPTAASLRPADRFLAIGRIDTRHPVLAGTDGWQGVAVVRNLPIAELPGDEVLIRLSNNEPFLIERRLGGGRMLLVTGALDNRWNDLPVRPVFVSFMVEAARYLSGVGAIERTHTAGASLPLALADGSSGQVVDPDGNTVLSLADTTREQQVRLEKTGFYEVHTTEGRTLIAANVDSRESDLAKITQQVLDDWQASTGVQGVATGAGFTAEVPQTVPLWQWALMVLALVVIGESILGNMSFTPRDTERA
ncbi:MAG: BatA and WFA domain-containing protein [Gammaproteobacteria bacterium]|nr:BatA and WFA domain-containing protein [Gammaproteobacteria bacterium]MDH5344285.1 BatA and WFA domain-containing protein [Gammaproteobacteria bacterium]